MWWQIAADPGGSSLGAGRVFAELGLRPSLAHACAGFAGRIVVGGLALTGKSKFSPANLAPKRTLDELARDVDATKRVL